MKERAFLPPADLRLSVFVVDTLAHEQVIEIGRSVSERELRAYAMFEAAAALEQGLTVERNDEPFRHAELAGWPTEKEHRKEIARELASAATLHLP